LFLVGGTTVGVFLAEFSARRQLMQELREACRRESL